MSYGNPINVTFLTKEQRDVLAAQALEWERHNLWLMLKETTGMGCLCSKCNENTD